MSGVRVERVGPTRDLLGESPLWDERQQALYWIDSRARRVQRWHPSNDALRHWDLPQDPGAIALADGASLVLTLEDGFYMLDLASGRTSALAAVQHPAPSMRMNDGRTDRAGRFLCGSMALGRREAVGGLYQLGCDGTLRMLDRGFCTSNSTCFSPDGRWLYFADSHERCIWRYPYDTATGQLAGAREVFVDTTSLDSVPDGATVDADGGVWVALVQTGQVARFTPAGKLDARIQLPVPYVSCPCIGGEALDTIYLTTISNSGHMLRTDHPDAGALFAVHGTGVRGLPEVRFDHSQLSHRSQP